MEKLRNEKNERSHTDGVKEGPADCISIGKVAAALKAMKRNKDSGLSGLAAEIIQSTGDIGTQWMLGCIPEDWKRSVLQWYYQHTKGKVTQWSVYLTEGLNCWNMVGKWWNGYLNTEFGSKLRTTLCSVNL